MTLKTMLLMHFDDSVVKYVGKIPKRVQPFFNILGYLSMPAGWMSVMALVATCQLLRGHDPRNSLIILVLLPFAAIVKLFVRRSRPPTFYAAAMRVKSYSFPSSHAYAATLSGGQLAMSAFTNALPAIGVLVVILIITIGISRVHLGAHYPSDVLAGWLLGAGILAIIVS